MGAVGDPGNLKVAPAGDVSSKSEPFDSNVGSTSLCMKIELSLGEASTSALFWIVPWTRTLLLSLDRGSATGASKRSSAEDEF